MADQPKKTHFNVLGVNKPAANNTTAADESKLNHELDTAFGLPDQEEVNAPAQPVVTPQHAQSAPKQSTNFDNAFKSAPGTAAAPTTAPLADNTAVQKMATGTRQAIDNVPSAPTVSQQQAASAVPNTNVPPATANPSPVQSPVNPPVSPTPAPMQQPMMPSAPVTQNTPYTQNSSAITHNGAPQPYSQSLGTTTSIPAHQGGPGPNPIQKQKSKGKGKLIVIGAIIFFIVAALTGGGIFLTSTGTLDDWMNGKNSENSKKAYISEVDGIIKNMASDTKELEKQMPSSASDLQDLEKIVQGFESISKKAEGYKKQIEDLDTPDAYTDLKRECTTLLDEFINCYGESATTIQSVINDAMGGKIKSTDEIYRKLAPIMTAETRLKNAIETYNKVGSDYGLTQIKAESSFSGGFF